jgi:hypothetical protein
MVYFYLIETGAQRIVCCRIRHLTFINPWFALMLIVVGDVVWKLVKEAFVSGSFDPQLVETLIFLIP